MGFNLYFSLKNILFLPSVKWISTSILFSKKIKYLKDFLYIKVNN